MAPKATRKGKVKAKAKMTTSVINRHLLLYWDRINLLFREHIRGLIRTHIVSSIKNELAWDLV
jgi:hypothetical protein